MNELREALRGAAVVLIIVTLGGGTGSGAAPVIAEIAASLTIHTLVLATTPMSFEASRRKAADKGLADLQKAAVVSLIVVANDYLLKEAGPETAMSEVMSMPAIPALRAIKSIAALYYADNDGKLVPAELQKIMAGEFAALRD